MHLHVSAESFAREWVDTWNQRDLKAILSHYAEGVVFTSPFIVKVMNDPNGTVKGIQKLRHYFERVLKLYPDVRFEFVAALEGMNSVMVFYRGVKKFLVAEVMFFNTEGKITKVFAHYERKENL
jgi:hypothetical protein